jgi:hypothetical protein
VTASALRIGSSSAGDIVFNDQISPAATNLLELGTAADIQDNHGNTFPVVALRHPHSHRSEFKIASPSN